MQKLYQKLITCIYGMRTLISNGVVKRIISYVQANIFGQIVTVAMQLVSVPLFLHYWDLDKYGKWIFISAVPAYFSMADVGMVAVASNKMAILMSKGKQTEANKVFQSVLVLTSIILCAIAACATITILIFKNNYLEDIEVKYSLLMLIYLAVLNIYGGLFDAVLRATGKYSLGQYLLNFARIFEWICGAVALMEGFGYLGVSISMFLGRFFLYILIFVYVKKINSCFLWGVKYANYLDIKKMIRPALAFMSFPIGNALCIQGMSIIVGVLFGSSFLAIFNTYRTISRILVQLITTVSRSVWPEISNLYGKENFESIKKIVRSGTLMISSASVFLAIVIYLSAPMLLKYWTQNKIPYDSILLTLFLFSTVTTSFWQLHMVVAMATNNHEKISYVYILISIVTVSFAFAFKSIFGHYSSIVALILFEIVMYFVAKRECVKILKKNVHSILV
jgi:O-antigen/teichoic acid export membrane protein